jgi:long-chain fatty acid transport protein
VTDDLSVGVSGVIGFGLLELGLVDNTALKDAFGFRGSVGATYDLGPIQIGTVYNSPLSYEFDDVTETSPGNFTDFKLTLPQDAAIGISNSMPAGRTGAMQMVSRMSGRTSSFSRSAVSMKWAPCRSGWDTAI